MRHRRFRDSLGHGEDAARALGQVSPVHFTKEAERRLRLFRGREVKNGLKSNGFEDWAGMILPWQGHVKLAGGASHRITV